MTSACLISICLSLHLAANNYHKVYFRWEKYQMRSQLFFLDCSEIKMRANGVLFLDEFPLIILMPQTMPKFAKISKYSKDRNSIWNLIILIVFSEKTTVFSRGSSQKYPKLCSDLPRHQSQKKNPIHISVAPAARTNGDVWSTASQICLQRKKTVSSLKKFVRNIQTKLHDILRKYKWRVSLSYEWERSD